MGLPLCSWKSFSQETLIKSFARPHIATRLESCNDFIAAINGKLDYKSRLESDIKTLKNRIKCFMIKANYKKMLTNQRFEERIKQLYRAGEFFGAISSKPGQNRSHA